MYKAISVVKLADVKCKIIYVCHCQLIVTMACASVSYPCHYGLCQIHVTNIRVTVSDLWPWEEAWQSHPLHDVSPHHHILCQSPALLLHQRLPQV